MSNEDVKFQVGAEDTGVVATMAKIEEQIATVTETIKSRFEGIVGTIEKVNIAFRALQNALAGGEAFKEAIESTVNMTTSAQKLGRQLGVSATDASVLNVALASVFVTQDQYSAGAAKIGAALKKNESAFHDLGVATRDSNGEYLNQMDIMQATNERLMEFKEGTDRNVEGIKIYGKAWTEVAPTLKVTGEVLEEARKKADALGLTVGADNVAASNRYRTAMNDVHEVIEGIEKTIGDALIPILSDLGEWFASVGPQVVDGFRKGLLLVTIAFEELKASVEIAFDWITGGFKQMVALSEGFGRTIKAAFTPGEDAGAEWDKTWREYQRIGDEYSGKIVKDAQDASEAMTQAFSRAFDKQKPAAKGKGGNETSEGGDDKVKNQMAELHAQLEAKKVAYGEEQRLQGSFHEFSKQQEIDYWQNILSTVNLNAANRLTVETSINKLKLAADKEAYGEELAAIKTRESEYKSNLEAKLAIAKEYAAKIAAAEGADSKAGQGAAQQVIAIENQIAAQRLAIAKTAQTAMDNVRLSEIDTAQKVAQDEVRAGTISVQQLLALEKQFADEKYQIKLTELQREFAAEAESPDRNPAKLATLNAQILQLQTQHSSQIAALNLKSAQEQRKPWDDTFKTMERGFQGVFARFANGTASLSQSVRGLFVSVAQSVASSLEQMAAKNLTIMLQQAAMGKTIKLKELAGNAYAAAGSAYKAIVGIPYVGPFLAPAAAATAFAGVMAFGGGISAEGGYDIPANVNPIVQTHAREMILPEKYADTIRNLGHGGTGGMNSAELGKVMDKALQRNSAAIVRQIRESADGFA